jgi:ribonuclease HII
MSAGEPPRRQKPRPDFRYEHLARAGFQVVAGVDEAGRGPLAGPVVAAAVILPPESESDWLGVLDDSKQLSPGLRRDLYRKLIDSAAMVAWAEVSVREIERHNIAVASRLAMVQALDKLPVRPDLILVDGTDGLRYPIAHWPVIKGDSLSASIAAASIAAKEIRDGIMDRLHRRHPVYGFDHNRGYGTPDHLAALEKYGPCPAHRRTFAPVKAVIGRRSRQRGLFNHEP